jgi:hypothetical protein
LISVKVLNAKGRVNGRLDSIPTPHAGQAFSKKQGVTPAIAMQIVQIGAKKRMAAPK